MLCSWPGCSSTLPGGRQLTRGTGWRAGGEGRGRECFHKRLPESMMWDHLCGPLTLLDPSICDHLDTCTHSTDWNGGLESWHIFASLPGLANPPRDQLVPPAPPSASTSGLALGNPPPRRLWCGQTDLTPWAPPQVPVGSESVNAPSSASETPPWAFCRANEKGYSCEGEGDAWSC